MSSCPPHLDLTGVWSAPESDFLWERLQVFPRRASAHPQDYWVAFASGACLASRCILTAARLDTATGLLCFAPAARQAVGPRCILAPPGQPPLLLGPESLQHAQRVGWLRDGRWQDAAHAHAALLQHHPWRVLVHQSTAMQDALEVWPLPHGGQVNPLRLLALDTQPPRPALSRRLGVERR